MRLTGSKLTGNNAHAYLGFCDGSAATGALEAGKLYFIREKAGDVEGFLAKLPEGTFFKARGGEQVGSSKLMGIDPEQLYKTSADFSMEQGVVEIGDDRDPGAKMLDGIVSISGSVSGIFRYNEDDGSFDDVTVNVINTFMDAVEDRDGSYEYVPRNDSRVFLLLLMNATAKADQYENWLYVPIIVSSVNMSFGNTEAQTRELSWTKGEGQAVRYVVKKAG